MKFFYLLIVIFCFNLHSRSQTSEELATSFVKKLERQQYDSCYAMFDTVIANKISVDMLSQMWASIPRYMGEYKGFTSVTKQLKDSFELIFVRCEFEKTKMDLQLVFENPPKKIVGMFFTPPKSKNAYVAPEYALTHKYYETKIAVKTGTMSLPGALCVPNNVKNPPVAILLAGSGPNDKDESIGPNKPLKDLATGLASNGIATYRYDKRTLTYAKESSEQMDKFDLNKEVIEDALSAVAMLKKNPDFKNSKIFIVGHSLGAMSAPMIASKSKGVNGIVLLAGNARPLEDLLLEQYTYVFGLDSIDASEKKEIDSLTHQIKTLKDPKRLKTATKEQLPLNLPSVYWQSFVNYNQLQVAKKLKQPILVLQGERDYQVTMTDFNLWKQLLGENPKNRFISYPSLNHMLMKGEGKSVPVEYEKQGNVDEQVIKDIADWIKTQ
jgi:dienelactone hydrolase